MTFNRHLKKLVTNRQRPLTEGSIRHHLNALSRLFRRGRELEVVPLGYSTLLFPSFETGQEAMITDVRKLLDRIGVRAGFLRPLLDSRTGQQRRKPSGEPMWEGTPIRTRIFRHTYCSARLQTLDRGEPVTTYTVRCELGHGSDDMVNKVYAHLGEIRHRSEAVEYRVSQHLEGLGDRLKGLGLALP